MSLAQFIAVLLVCLSSVYAPEVHAEIITIDVTISAINIEDRLITVTRTSRLKEIELEVGKKAKITIGGMEASLEALAVGMTATISFEPELEIVTKIDAGDGDHALSGAEDDGFESLISKDTLDGWYFAAALDETPNWEVESEELIYRSQGPSLVSDNKYSDFELHVDFKLPKNCNCGVLLLGRYELKLTDTPKGRPTSLKPNGRIGAIYGKIAPTTNAYKGTNKWNKVIVKMVGKVVTVIMNDEVVIAEKEIEGPPLQYAIDRNEGEPGPIVMWAHPQGVGARFRNMRIRRLEE
jgi:hypothetical protein